MTSAVWQGRMDDVAGADLWADDSMGVGRVGPTYDILRASVAWGRRVNS